jgi:hypothetical protein
MKILYKYYSLAKNPIKSIEFSNNYLQQSQYIFQSS